MRWEWEEAHTSGPVFGNGSTVHLADTMTGRKKAFAWMLFLMRTLGRRRYYHYLRYLCIFFFTLLLLLYYERSEQSLLKGERPGQTSTKFLHFL
jgi:hypothetical protein